MRIRTTIGLLAITLAVPLAALAEPYFVGAKKCAKCHEEELNVWKGTVHYTTYKTVPKSPHAYKVLRSVRGGKNMKKSQFCTLCHFTMVSKNADSIPRARAGVSCESCHGPASEWLALHTDFGEGATLETESPAHRAERLAKSRKAGLIMSSMHFDIAENCMSCHGLATEGLDADTLAIMLDAKHPLVPEFEFVRYSQGTVRHRFYPPNMSQNAEMSDVELARFFVVGQAAKLVSASNAAKRAKDPRYKAAQRKRAEEAAKVLAAVKSVAQAAALIASPTEANARKLVDAIQDKDLSGEVGPLLPAKNTYK